MSYKSSSNPALDLELLFLTNVLKLTSLHYGYWNENDDLTVKNFRVAQQRYTDTLIDMIPDGVNTILDVGCGIGDVSEAMAEQGHQVTALSPDENHRQYFEEHRNGQVAFHNSKFENFNTSMKFDMVLMSESQNYFDMDMGFQQTINHLCRGGYLLVSGTFKKAVSDVFKRVVSIEDKYLERAKSYGLELLKVEDITKYVMPQTLFERNLLEAHIIPLIDIFKRSTGKSLSFRFKLLKIFNRKILNFLTEVYEDRVQRADPALVKQHLKYMRFLFAYR